MRYNGNCTLARDGEDMLSAQDPRGGIRSALLTDYAHAGDDWRAPVTVWIRNKTV